MMHMSGGAVSVQRQSDPSLIRPVPPVFNCLRQLHVRHVLRIRAWLACCI
jgi:hypothetical protein